MSIDSSTIIWKHGEKAIEKVVACCGIVLAAFEVGKMMGERNDGKLLLENVDSVEKEDNVAFFAMY